LLKIIKRTDFQNDVTTIFDFNNIPINIKHIYDYSKTVSKIIKDNNIYYVCGQKIHKRDNTCHKLLCYDINPIGIYDVTMSSNNLTNLNYIEKEYRDYYYRILCTIKLRCY